ncbi:hypothetical protein Moror_2542 [Moniliophthora roreri MCA 2997]|uniref:LysM domain-containing protein n=2 Tax=Moniliophthora roreri TaxID=221103 RepID=V2YIX7_MONRO|nr:hypothetical protein Moror_2542 [Moniliophthora roreri MCA 2997]KAI3610367.1 hypothetical protein WG66_006757 [Moniliophthora roreri]
MFSKSILAVTLPLLASSAIAGPCVRKYTVKAGDTCDKISAEQSVSTYQLAAINAGYIDELCHNLAIDDTICIGYENEDCDQTYVVKDGDTCSAITANHGIDMTLLLANNPQINDNCTNIYNGEVLNVCKDVIVPPTPDGKPVEITPPANATPASLGTPANTNTQQDNNQQDDDNDDHDDDESLPFCDEL